MKALRILLIIIAIVGIGVAVSYPIRYKMELDSTNEEISSLSDMRKRVLEAEHLLPTPLPEAKTASTDAPAPTTAEPTTAEPAAETAQPATAEPAAATAQPATAEPAAETAQPATAEPAAETAQPATAEPIAATAETATAEPVTEPPAETVVEAPPEEIAAETVESESAAEAAATPEPTPSAGPTQPPTPSPTPTPRFEDMILDDPAICLHSPTPSPTPTPTPTPTPSPTPDRRLRDDADPYADKEKVTLDPEKMLPELKDIYALNNDLIGWLYIEGTNIDYPVVQHEDREYYLRRDFYGNDNANGQIILDAGCDPYTPSYNLVISGHHMNSGAMFGKLQLYKDYEFWQTHKILEFDSLMERKRYVIFAAFYSADYDENEEGFRYSVNILYKIDADNWLKEIEAYKIYDTGIDAEFGDEFITLTTCDHSRRDDGRFVVVARRIREGETIE